MASQMTIDNNIPIFHLANGRWSRIHIEDLEKFMIVQIGDTVQGMLTKFEPRYSEIWNKWEYVIKLEDITQAEGSLEHNILMNLCKKYITSQEVQDIVLFNLKRTVPAYFWHIPASSTGKRHPQYALGLGGVARHTVVATGLLIELLQLEYNQKRINEYTRDVMIAAIILHDTFKCGTQSEYAKAKEIRGSLPQGKRESITRKDHAHLVQISGPTGSNIPNDINHFIKRHMGSWGDKKPEIYTEILVHMVDFLASREYLEADMTKLIDKMLPKEE